MIHTITILYSTVACHVNEFFSTVNFCCSCLVSCRLYEASNTAEAYCQSHREASEYKPRTIPFLGIPYDRFARMGPSNYTSYKQYLLQPYERDQTNTRSSHCSRLLFPLPNVVALLESCTEFRHVPCQRSSMACWYLLIKVRKRRDCHTDAAVVLQ